MWARLFLSTSLGAAFLLGPSAVTVQRGEALFNGKEPLSGRIREHDETLPPEVVRCVNCHGASARPSRVAAPHLDGSRLLEFHQRRGGPPSRYDQSAFCKLLRSGVDPVQIMIAREMPVYALDDDQCASLWSFLVGKDAARKENGGKEKKADANETH